MSSVEIFICRSNDEQCRRHGAKASELKMEIKKEKLKNYAQENVENAYFKLKMRKISK